MVKLKRERPLMAAVAVPLPPDVDPDKVDYWAVRVKDAFVHANVVFQPTVAYRVKPWVYNSTLEDGSTFQSHCATAAAEIKQP